MTDKLFPIMIIIIIIGAGITLIILGSDGINTQDMLFTKIPNSTCIELEEIHLHYYAYLQGDDQLIYKSKQLRDKFIERFAELKC